MKMSRSIRSFVFIIFLAGVVLSSFAFPSSLELYRSQSVGNHLPVGLFDEIPSSSMTTTTTTTTTIGSPNRRFSSSSRSFRTELSCFFFSKKTTVEDPSASPVAEDAALSGKVIRTASRAYDKDKSKPSSREYTTQKDASKSIQVDKSGIVGDYNHYRTVALKSTKDRAVSLWTVDVMDLLHKANFPVQVGDLGENLSISGVDYTFFKVGQQYRFVVHHDNENAATAATTTTTTTTTTSSSTVNNNNDTSSVVIEITERMEPCGNLCKLPYINDPTKSPNERIETCKNLISLLDQKDGLRGWYAKVIQEGIIHDGDSVVKI